LVSLIEVIGPPQFGPVLGRLVLIGKLLELDSRNLFILVFVVCAPVFNVNNIWIVGSRNCNINNSWIIAAAIAFPFSVLVLFF
jgi:hypothetical protein